MAAASARALLISRFNDFRLSLKLPPPHHLNLHRPSHRTQSQTPAKSLSPSVLCCLVSGVDGGGVADDFVPTQKSALRREFSVLATVLRQIEPLDTSIIAEGVSGAAKNSMKRTISTMLGLLPSDLFRVTIRVSNLPLHRLLVSSIITGYTLWNAEYRVSLMRNFGASSGETRTNEVSSNLSSECETPSDECEDRVGGDGVDGCYSSKSSEGNLVQMLGDLPPAALNYIQELKSQLADVEEAQAMETGNVK